MFLPVAVSLSSEGVLVSAQTVSAAATPVVVTLGVTPSNPAPGQSVTVDVETNAGSIGGTAAWTVNGASVTGSTDTTVGRPIYTFVPGSGTSTVAVTFTPTDSATWAPGSSSVDINPATGTATQNVKDASPGCGSGLNPWSSSNLGGCLEDFAYYIPYSAGGWLLARSAEILDISATYTLSSKLFTSSQFITDGWHATRDIANMFFIFVLLYIAITLILDIGTGHANPKKMLVSVILVALLINFSMFFTEVVIDTSNTFALLFYNQITVLNKNGTPATDADATAVGSNTGVHQTDVAGALAQAFEPQQFQSADFFNKLPQDPNTQKPTVTTMLMLLICIGGIFCVAAYSFFVAGLSFIGRLIQLMICVIFAPLAFISLVVPVLAKQDGIGWDSWLHSLMSAAFGAPIYFFFILLISKMAQSPLVVQTTAAAVGADSTTTLLTLFLSFIILVVLLNQATAYAKKSAGKLGEMTANFGASAFKLAGGFALGTATGGLAFVGQKTIGAVGDQVSKSETLRDKAINGNAFERRYAKFAINQGKNAATSSFDFGNTAAAKGIQKSTGMNFKVLPGLKGISPAANRGGYEARKKRKTDKDKKFADGLEYNKTKQTELDKVVSSREGAIGNLTAAINDLKATEKENASALKEATANLAEARANPSDAKNADGVPVNVAQAQKDQNKAKDNLSKTQSAITAKTKDVNDLTVGKKAKNADGTDGKVYTEDDVKNGTLKADGSKVTVEDLGLNYQKKLAENHKKARANAFLHQQMKKTGYKVRGAKVDALGHYENAGYVDTHEAAHRMRAVIDEARKGLVGGAIAGAAAGAVLPGIGSVVTGATLGAAGMLSGLVVGFKKQLNPEIPGRSPAASTASSTGTTAAPIPVSGGAPIPFVQPAQLEHKSTLKFDFEAPAAPAPETPAAEKPEPTPALTT